MWNVIVEEFSDLQDGAQLVRVSLRLIVAAILGGALGYERETHGKQAGLRTHMLVAVGAALLSLVPQVANMPAESASRVLQGVLAGIGFLGAGAIIRSEEKQSVQGLTTAASIWMTSAIGIAVGVGREGTAVLSTIIALLILGVIPRIERRLKKQTTHS